MTNSELLLATATSIPCSILAIYEDEEYGFTIPEVPKMEIPFIIPTRSLRVRFANFFPLVT